MLPILMSRWYKIFLPGLLALLLSACRVNQPPVEALPTASLEAVAVVETATQAPTETAPPTPTETAGSAILYAPEGADPGLVDRVLPVISELAAAASLPLESRPSLEPGELETGSGIVVALPPAAGLAELAAAAPEYQFLAVGIPGLTPTSNLSLIGPEGHRPDLEGFLAGYLAAVLTPDWRVGVITPSAAGAGLAARNGFLNGVIFYCGLCRPAYPPYYTYPVYVEAPPGNSSQAQAAAQAMIDQAVQTVYVVPGAGDQEMLNVLAEAGLAIIGGGEPDPAVENRWVTSIDANLEESLQEIWPDLIAGQGGASLPVSLSMEHRNPQLFSPGRQAWVEQLVSDLSSGEIDSGIDPQTGESLQPVPWGN